MFNLLDIIISEGKILSHIKIAKRRRENLCIWGPQPQALQEVDKHVYRRSTVDSI